MSFKRPVSQELKKAAFSQKLIQRTITYFHHKYGVLLSEAEVQEALESFSELFALFSSLQKVGGLSAPARTLREGRAQKGRPEGGLT